MLPRFHPALVALAGLSWASGPAPTPAARVRWGAEGHQLVALLAYPLLKPSARASVDSLLGDSTMAEVATWADEIRPKRLYTAPYHFVDIPLAITSYDSARDCKGGRCVVHAIAAYRATLADTTQPRVKRIEALKFLIHFVGDIHQPLHDADNHDRGGNQVSVHLGGHATNLHSAWDSGLLAVTGFTEDEYLTLLQQKLATLDTAALGAGTVKQWAEESHHLAAVNAYHFPASHDLNTPYISANIPVIELQLIRAAVRLARMLNEVLG